MAQVVWTEPALADLDAIADYIALDNPEAARRLVQRVFKQVEQLERHPKSGSIPAELRGSRYRQIVEPPCRVFYRSDAKWVWILHVMRSERLLRPGQLRQRDRKTRPGRRPGKTGGYAALASNVSCIPGYQRDSVERHSLFKTRVRTCSKRWAPGSVHRICCFFTIRLLTT